MRRGLAGTGILLALVSVAACAGSPPDTLGPRDGTLLPCPSELDCVHTGLRHPDGTRGFFVRGSIGRNYIVGRIREVVEEMPRATVVTEDENYLHVEFRRGVFGNVDDLEIFVNPSREAIVRSSPRRRVEDSTVNAERVEDLRRRLTEARVLR